MAVANLTTLASLIVLIVAAGLSFLLVGAVLVAIIIALKKQK